MDDKRVINKSPSSKISIIIVTLNVIATLQACLDSIYIQAYPLLEIIVMDGGSTDGTVDLLKANDAHIALWNSEKDKGIYDAMNKALEYITGDWVYFLGADDVLFDDFSDLVCQVKDHSVIYYGSVLMKGKKNKGEVKPYQHAKDNICHQAIIYPKEVFERYRFNTDYKISADHVLNMQCWRHFRFQYIDLVVANFNDTGVSSLNIDQQFEKDRPWLILKYHGFTIYARFIFRLLKMSLFPKNYKDLEDKPQ
jgi:glycosyltransferase involved in cell wall biosynthesis